MFFFLTTDPGGIVGPTDFLDVDVRSLQLAWAVTRLLSTGLTFDIIKLGLEKKGTVNWTDIRVVALSRIWYYDC